MTDRFSDPALWAALSVGIYLAWALLAGGSARQLHGRLPARVGGPGRSPCRTGRRLDLLRGHTLPGADLRGHRPAHLGLFGADPLAGCLLAAVIALAAWALLALAWRRWADAGASLALVRPAAAAPVTRRTVPGRRGYTQCHLAFYRAVFALAAGAYAGVFAGLGLLVVEWLAGAAIRRRWPGDSTPEGEIILLANLAGHQPAVPGRQQPAGLPAGPFRRGTRCRVGGRPRACGRDGSGGPLDRPIPANANGSPRTEIPGEPFSLP